jgi:GntR family transcriptional regulator
MTNSNIFNKENIVNPDNSIPLYHQILNYIRYQIQSGGLKPGDPIPPETELSKMYNISRTTVRQALDILAEENLIVRRRGKGTFISNQKINRDLNHLYSFSEDMRAMNLIPSSKVLEQSILKAPEDIAKALRLTSNTEIFKLMRVRYADNEPILLETTFVPFYLCAGIEKEDFSGISLYSVLRLKYNLNLYRAVETYEAVKQSNLSAKHLACSLSDPAFYIRRTAYLDNDLPFELTHSIARSDKCIFKVELKSNTRHANFTRMFTP